MKWSLQKSVIAGTLAAVTFSAVVTANTGSAVAAARGDLSFKSWGTNAAGADTAGNRNAEFVRLSNTTGAARDVTGWVVHDNYQTAGGDWGNRFTFRGDTFPVGHAFRGAGADTTPGTADDRTVVPAGGEVYVYNGSGMDSTPGNTTGSVYRNFKHVYNNAGDTLYVRESNDASGYVAKLTYTPYRVDLVQ